MTSFIIFTVIKCGFLDTWISNTHINMALHFGYKCKKKILKRFYIMHINFDW